MKRPSSSRLQLAEKQRESSGLAIILRQTRHTPVNLLHSFTSAAVSTRQALKDLRLMSSIGPQKEVRLIFSSFILALYAGTGA